MDLYRNTWKTKSEVYSLLPSRLKASSSTSKLSEFHSKLTSKGKSPQILSIPSWKVFRSKIRNNVSPPRLERPKLDHYTDLASFRSSSPRIGGSPLWKNRIRNGSIHSNVSTPSSPKPGRSNKVFQVIKIEELKKIVEVLNDIDENDINSLPMRYIQELKELCKVIKERLID
jgi:hypothetical protein